MSVAPANLNPIFLQNPQKTVQQLQHKAFTYNVLSKICVVAFLAIAAVCTSIPLGLLPAPTGIYTFLLLGSIISAFPLMYGASKFHTSSNRLKYLLHEERSVTQKLETLKTVDVEEFYTRHHQLTKPSLENSLLLPVVARFEALQEKAIFLYNRAVHDIQFTSENEIFNVKSRKQGWRVLEMEFGPTLLKLTWFLQLLEDPTLPDPPQGIHPKKLSYRWFGGRSLSEPDLRYYGDITVSEIYDNGPNPTTLRPRFLSAVQALNERSSRSDAQDGKRFIQDSYEECKTAAISDTP